MAGEEVTSAWLASLRSLTVVSSALCLPTLPPALASRGVILLSRVRGPKMCSDTCAERIESLC